MAPQPTNYKSSLKIYSKLPAPAIQQTLSASLSRPVRSALIPTIFFLRRRLGFLRRLSTCVPHAGPHLRSPASPAWRISSELQSAARPCRPIKRAPTLPSTFCPGRSRQFYPATGAVLSWREWFYPIKSRFVYAFLLLV